MGKMLIKLKSVNSIIRKYGFVISRVYKSKHMFVENAFKRKNFTKRVLVSYLTEPFISGVKLNHSIYVECYTACEIFDQLGYCVDIVNYDETHFEPDFSIYSVIYGLGNLFERSFFSSVAEKQIRIHYATGTSMFNLYKINGNLVHQFYKKNNILIPESARMNIGFWPTQFTCSDAIIVLSNNTCKQTYLDINPNIDTYNLNAFFYDFTAKIDLSGKQIGKVRKNFLWFGSGGLLYKGLGILIEIFSKRSDINLFICGASVNEVKFWKHYEPIIQACNNIFNLGFIKIDSIEFSDLMNDCCFVIFPSTSEGGAVATINVMANGGLIPIISEGTCLDVEEHGFVFNQINSESINSILDKITQMHDEELQLLHRKTLDIVRKNYTLALYKNNLKNIITNILYKHDKKNI